MDWIVTVAALVMALIAAGIFYMQRPTPRTIAEPEKVIITPPAYPAGAVTYANSLPNAGSGGGGSAPSGMGSGAPSAGTKAAPGLGGFGPPSGGSMGVNTNRPGGPGGQMGPLGPGTPPGAGGPGGMPPGRLGGR